MRRIVPIACLCACLLSLACGGGHEATTARAEEVPAAPAAAPSQDELEAVYRDVLATLDSVYDEEGRPEANFDNLARVQNTAADRLSERFSEWPSGTSYSLSTLDDHIFVFVSSGEEEREGEWAPGT